MYLQLSEHPGKKMGIRENAEDFKENPNVRGYYDRVNHEIRINPAIPNSTLKFKTLVHEYAHSQLHRMDSPLKDLPRGHKEAQAEATAFMVTKYYGLDTEAYSAGYIATWTKDVKLAKQALGEIQKTANNIIREIDHLNREHIQEVIKTQPNDRSISNVQPVPNMDEAREVAAASIDKDEQQSKERDKSSVVESSKSKSGPELER